MFLSAMGLDNISRAERYTRYNGQIVKGEFRGAPGGYYKNGIQITKQDNTYRVIVWTIWDGKHVRSFDCSLSSDGKLQPGGTINYFGFGWGILNEQLYIDNFLKECADVTWDEVIPSET